MEGGNPSFQPLTMIRAEHRLHLRLRRSEATRKDLSAVGRRFGGSLAANCCYAAPVCESLITHVCVDPGGGRLPVGEAPAAINTLFSLIILHFNAGRASTFCTRWWLLLQPGPERSRSEAEGPAPRNASVRTMVKREGGGGP